MKNITAIRPKEATHIPEPPIARFLFADTRMAWLWLIVRLYVGYEWLTAGLEKLTGRDFTIGASFGKVVSSPWVLVRMMVPGSKASLWALWLRPLERIPPSRAGSPASCSTSCCPMSRPLHMS
ncbi:MAG TPA: hypothetical protein VFQ30_00950 [Ktedonobacteraceae bacterium]|nr:hypothetical protein [Ktedonobacteraceae bacterium]